MSENVPHAVPLRYQNIDLREAMEMFSSSQSMIMARSNNLRNNKMYFFTFKEVHIGCQFKRNQMINWKIGLQLSNTGQTGEHRH